MSHFYLLQYASADSRSDAQAKLSDRHNVRYYVAIATEKYGICLISIYFSMLLQTVNLMLWLNYQTQSNKVITVTLPTSNTSFAFHFTIISILQYIVVQGTFFDHLPFTNKVYFIYFISSSQTCIKSYQPGPKLTNRKSLRC